MAAPPIPGTPTLSLTSVLVRASQVARFSAATSSVVSSALTTPFTSALTFELWLKPSSSRVTDTILSLSAGSTLLSLSDPTNLEISLGSATLSTGVALGTGQWRHVALALTAPRSGAVSLWLTLDGVTVLRGTGALPVPGGWPASPQTLTIGKSTAMGATALEGEFSEFRGWATALPEGLIATRRFARLLAGSDGPLIAWALDAFPSGAKVTDASLLVSDMEFRQDTLQAAWSAVAGTSYTLQAWAEDHSWGVVYENLSSGHQTIDGYWLGHGVSARLRAKIGTSESDWSNEVSGPLFALAQPVPALSASMEGGVGKISETWPGVDQAESYLVTQEESGRPGTSSTQSTTTLDLSRQLLSTKAWTTTIAAVSGLVTGPASAPMTLTTPTPALTYDAPTPGRAGHVTLSWSSSPGAAKYWIVWTVSSGTPPAPQFVGSETNSLPPFVPPSTANVTYTAKVQAIAAGGVSATGSDEIVISDLAVPTIVQAVTAVTADAVPGEITLSWTYASPSAGLSFRVEILDESARLVTSGTTATTSLQLTSQQFTAANWFTGRVRYDHDGASGPWAQTTVFVLPSARGFNASLNTHGGVISATFDPVTAPSVSAKSAEIQYEVRIVGPISGNDCKQVPDRPAVDHTLGPIRSTTPTWPTGDVPGFDHNKTYSATVITVVKDNPSRSKPSACDTLEKYEPPAPSPGAKTVNDPIGVAAGNLIHFDNDLNIEAVLPIRFTLYYNSGFPTHAENSLIEDGSAGMRWRHGFETRITVDRKNNRVYVIEGTTAISSYNNQADANGRYSSHSPFNGDTLWQVAGGGYRWVRRDRSIWTFDTTGRAITAQDHHGNALDISYDKGRLHQVQLRHADAKITFSHDENGKLHTVTGSNGLVLTLTVTANQLVSLEVPEIGTRTYAYAATGSALLQQVTDPWGNTVVYNEYDSHGRVEKQYDGVGYKANPKYFTLLQYGTKAYGGKTVATTVVTQPEGEVTTYYSDPDAQVIVYQETPLGNNPAGQAISRIQTTSYNGFLRPYQVTVYRGPKASYVEGDGNTTTYDYDTNLNLARLTDPAGRVQTWLYDAANNLLEHRDIWGNRTRYDYNPGNLLHTITDAIGQTSTYTYWATSTLPFAGLIKTVTDPRANQAQLSYFASSGLLQSITYPKLSQHAYTYDASGREQTRSVSNPDGTQLSLVTTHYDNLGRRTSYAVQMGTQSADKAFHYTWTYDAPTKNTVVETDPDGNTLTTTLDANRRPITKAHDAFQGVVVSVTWGYDKNARLHSLALGSRAPTVYGYNGLDELISTTDPLGHQQSFFEQQVTEGRVRPYASEITHTMPDLAYPDPATQKPTEYRYVETSRLDPSGLEIDVEKSLAPSRSLDSPIWHQRRTLTRTRTAIGSGASQYYQVTVDDVTTPLVPTGSAVTGATEMDGIYRVVKKTDARAHVTNTAYATADDPETPSVKLVEVTTTPPVGAAIKRYFDPLGRNVAESSGRGNEARARLIRYDALHRFTRVRCGDTLANLAAGTLTAPGAAQVTYRYVFDESTGQPRMRVDTTVPTTDTSGAGAVAESSFFDAKNRRTREARSSGGSYQQSYAPWGSVATRVSPSGGRLTFAFDDAGSVLTVTPGSGPPIVHVLDAAGNRKQTKLGTIVSVTREFDAWNRMTQRSAGGSTIRQTLWPNGRMRSLTYPDAKRVSYSLDGFGAWHTVTDWSGRTTTYGYLATGELNTIAYPNGATATYSYNDAGAPSGMTLVGADGVVLADLTIASNSHNEMGSVSGVWACPPAIPAGPVTIHFDGDVLSKYDGTALSSNEDGSQTQIPSPTGKGSTVTVGYDAIGRLHSVGAISYGFDADGLRTTRTEGGSTTTYSFAPNLYQDVLLNLGSQTRKITDVRMHRPSTGNVTLMPVYGEGLEPACLCQNLDWLLSSTDTIHGSSHFVHGVGPISEDTSSGETHYLHADPAGNIVAVTDASGKPCGTMSYGPYGFSGERGQLFRSTFAYGGRFGVVDDRSGLLWMRARAYSPTLMRFSSRDILLGDPRNPTALHRYAYGLDNPTRYADPLGLSPLPGIIGLIGAGLAGLGCVAFCSAAGGAAAGGAAAGGAAAGGAAAGGAAAGGAAAGGATTAGVTAGETAAVEIAGAGLGEAGEGIGFGASDEIEMQEMGTGSEGTETDRLLTGAEPNTPEPGEHLKME